MTRVLVTGAAGAIGSVLRRGLAGRYELMRLSDIAPLGEAAPGEELVQGDIRDLAATEASLEGIDCVVHLAGCLDEKDWLSILAVNIAGTYTLFEAARRQGVKRVIFASSNHAVGFHRRERVIDAASLPRPDGRYGTSKVFGEALGRLYADKHGMSVACLRIGTFARRPSDERHLETWISPRDMVQLVRLCIDAPPYHFIVIYGVSANRRSRWLNAEPDVLGYVPKDDAETFAAEILAQDKLPDPIARQFHGGPLCAIEFSGDLARID
jgi:uronate dehydrogenase